MSPHVSQGRKHFYTVLIRTRNVLCYGFLAPSFFPVLLKCLLGCVHLVEFVASFLHWAMSHSVMVLPGGVTSKHLSTIRTNKWLVGQSMFLQFTSFLVFFATNVTHKVFHHFYSFSRHRDRSLCHYKSRWCSCSSTGSTERNRQKHTCDSNTRTRRRP